MGPFYGELKITTYRMKNFNLSSFFLSLFAFPIQEIHLTVAYRCYSFFQKILYFDKVLHLRILCLCQFRIFLSIIVHFFYCCFSIQRYPKNLCPISCRKVYFMLQNAVVFCIPDEEHSKSKSYALKINYLPQHMSSPPVLGGVNRRLCFMVTLC